MASALDSRSSRPGSSHGRGHCVVLLGNTYYFYFAFPRTVLLVQGFAKLFNSEKAANTTALRITCSL